MTDTPRIGPLSPDELDDQARELLGGAAAPNATARNIFATLVRHPGLFRRWMPFGGKLLAGKLPARDRELLILRTAWRCRSEYEWGQHVTIAQAAGLTREEIERVREGAVAAEWTPFESALLWAVDEMHESARIRDETWRLLSSQYDERQLIEVPMLVGHYHMLAFTLNTLGVPLEPDVAGFEP